MKILRVLMIFTGLLTNMEAANPVETWSASSIDGLPPSLNGRPDITGIAYGGGVYVAVGRQAVVAASVDGKKWEYKASLFNKTMTGVCFGNDRWVAFGGNNTFVSTAISNWSSFTISVSGSLASMDFGNGTFAAVTSAGNIISSTTGVNWISNLTTNRTLTKIRFLGGKWFVVGDNAFLLTSDDLKTWKQIPFSPSGPPYSFTDVTHSPDGHVVWGLDGAAYIENGALRPFKTARPVIGAVYTHGVFISQYDGLWVSYDKALWSRVLEESISAVVSGPNRIIVGKYDLNQILASGVFSNTSSSASVEMLPAVKIKGQTGREYHVKSSTSINGPWVESALIRLPVDDYIWTDPRIDQRKFYRVESVE